MKFILFNFNSTNKSHINKIYLDRVSYISELSLSKNILEKMDTAKKSFILKIKCIFLDKLIEKQIYKSLDGYNKKWNYILSNENVNSVYLQTKLKTMCGCKYISAGALDVNIFKYVDEYLEQHSSLKKHELKVLIVTDSNKNINFKLINSLIKQHKNVNIYLKEAPTSYTLKTIRNINKEEGSTVDIIKKERKVFTEYNVIYFVDDIRENYPRFRLNKNSLVIDNSLKEIDKFNSAMIFMEKYIESTEGLKENISYLLSKYSKLELAEVIRKTIN